MDVLNKIEQLKNERGWSVYKLAIESGVTTSTISNMFARKTLPSISTLSAICDAFGITVAQFFADEQYGEVLSNDENVLLQNYRKLSEKNKNAVSELVKTLTNN